MKKYVKPSIEVVKFETGNTLLAGSFKISDNETITTLSKRSGFVLDDEEDDVAEGW